jgi:hypothetical protein
MISGGGFQGKTETACQAAAQQRQQARSARLAAQVGPTSQWQLTQSGTFALESRSGVVDGFSLEYVRGDGPGSGNPGGVHC